MGTNQSVTTLFLSDEKFLSGEIKGGVQLCTQEYIKYITLAGYDVRTFAVKPRIGFFKRLKIKAGVDAYEHYAIDSYLQQLLQIIKDSAVKLVFFNQLSLAVWAEELKKYLDDDVKLIGLSHGNESADYLHDITRPGPASKLQIWKLGRLLVKEARLFSSALNGIIVLNENEVAVNTWLGADRVLYLPRMLATDMVPWTPEGLKAGFVGTLDHLPNRLGIQLLADELKARGYRHKLMLVGGPVEIGQEFANRYEFIEYAGPLSDAKLADEVRTWTVFLNPVFWFARGASTKLALAINWGIPCLTTVAGRRGYVLADETIVTKDNNEASFACLVIRAMEDPVYLHCLKKASELNARTFDREPWIAQLKAFLQ